MLGEQVQSDDPEVAAVLSRIIRTVTAGGGRLDPTVRLVAESGDLSLATASAVSAGDTLVCVPHELQIPTDGLVFEDSTTEMRLASPAEGLSEVQRHLLDLQIELYNLTGKIPEIARSHPRLDTAWLDGAEPALRSLRAWIPERGLLATEVFLATRRSVAPRRYDGDAEESDSAAAALPPRPERVLMPIIDLVNHHPKARPFLRRSDSLSLLASYRGDQQCFAMYGPRKDPLDLALWFGYLDHNVTEAVSGRFKVEADQFGPVEVLGARPKRTSTLDPPVLEETSDGLILSHLMFDEAAPSRFWASLTMAVQIVLSRRGETATRVGTIVESIAIGVARANIQALRTLSHNSDSRAEEPAAVLMATAARRQAEIIANVVPDAV